ncbi:MAG TPA: hypothetical protein VMT35_06430 [Ignavibacteriaceae bacterium]|nr:hypothetical protein [Ignavibacteriaceae bacterium]
MSKVKSLMCIVALTFFLAGSLAAQDTSSSQGTQGQTQSGKTYDNMQGQAQSQNPQKELATDLQARINLTQEQTKQVQDILNEYQSSSASTTEGTSKDAETSANDKIASLLDDNQKASFESVKSDWWNEVKEKLGPSQEKGNQNNNDMNNQGTQSDTTKY